MSFLLLLLACTGGATPKAPDPDPEEGCAGGAAEQRFWPDGDGDGHGDATGTPVDACEAPSGHVSEGTDCDDTRAEVHPGATEVCDGLDDDCDGQGDEAVGRWYADADGDGYGDPATGEDTCSPAASSVADATDCDDADPLVNPGAPEECDLDDDNCDGRADVGVVSDWYTDIDGDGYGDPATATPTCDPEPGRVRDGGDCLPDEASAHPGAAEVCEDGVDQDCSGVDLSCGYDGNYDLSVDADALLYAPNPNSDLGRKFAVGDTDGDGAEDLLVAALSEDRYAGGGYVLAGEGWSGTMSIAEPGVRIAGSPDTTYGAGRSVGLGDMDGDGLADAGFGAPYRDAPGLFAAFGPFDTDRVLTPDPDVFLQGPANQYCGHGSDLGDLDGDGSADGVVGCYMGGSTGGGAVYVAYGPFSAGDHVVLENDADVLIDATSRSSYAGRWVAARGDHDGDGVADLLISAPYMSVGGLPVGGVYVVFGPPSAAMSMADADVLIAGDQSGAATGEGIAQGDVDGDGRDDVVVCAPGDATGGSTAGAVYVLSSPAAGTTDVSAADIAVFGDTAGGAVGFGVATHDADGDGLGDLLFGAYGYARGGASSGAAFFFSGPAAGAYTVADAQASFFGMTPGGMVGLGVAMADTDADGFSEIFLGAPADSTGGAAAGAVYVIEPTL